MSYARRVDANQAAIVRELRQRGYLVRANKTGDGSEDLTVSKRGWCFAVLFEVKRDGRAKLKPKQAEARQNGWPVWIVTDAISALKELQEISRHHAGHHEVKL